VASTFALTFKDPNGFSALQLSGKSLLSGNGKGGMGIPHKKNPGIGYGLFPCFVKLRPDAAMFPIMASFTKVLLYLAIV
jgi:hypothetical protein